jgi:hypothetical protein
MLTKNRLYLLFNKVISCLLKHAYNEFLGLNIISHCCADRGEVNTLHFLSYFNSLLISCTLVIKIKSISI